LYQEKKNINSFSSSDLAANEVILASITFLAHQRYDVAII